ncbi:MAG TPA: hypothetical protein VIX59_08730 [Candidatus Binataceae bacterium]
MINSDRVIRIEEVREGGRVRGCNLYYSATEFFAVDDGLVQIMQRLGFEPRS